MNSKWTEKPRMPGIKETYALTRERRINQIPLTFRMKVRNKKTGVFDFLKMCFVEGKWIWNSIIAQTNNKLGADVHKLSSFTQKEFKSMLTCMDNAKGH